MATLQHVSIWNNEHGWQSVTSREASEKFSCTIRSSSKTFMCELCGQYVTFVNGVNIPHFKHPNGSEDCDEKITTYNNYYLTNPQGFSLPLKIKINNNALEILIGFLPLSDDMFRLFQGNNSKLSISVNDKTLRQFSIDSSRFSIEQITYLSVGDAIAKEYTISYPNSNLSLKNYWPTIVNGINPKGTVFDYDSGKRLPENANVTVGNSYLLIIHKWSNIPYSQDVTITKEYSFCDYNVFEVIADKISRSADDFFRHFSCRLTDNPVTLTLLYPFSVNSSHVIRYIENKVWFHKTNGFIHGYPFVSLYRQVSAAGIFSLSRGAQQLISVSRFEKNISVLRYILLNKVDFIEERPTLSKLRIFDNQNESIEAGIYNSLPKDREIHIVAEYDGFVEVIKNDNVINKIFLKSNVKTTVDVDYGLIYCIYQGLDCYYELQYYKPILNSINDEELLIELQSYRNDVVSVNHSIHILANNLNRFPKSKQWLRKQIKQGKIDKKSIKRILEVK